MIHRRALAAVFRQVRPRLVFAPYWEDAHPDHTAATKLVEDARFWSKLSKSDITGKPFHPARSCTTSASIYGSSSGPASCVDISDQLDAKVTALHCFRSQLVENQPADQPSVIDSGLRPHPILGSVGWRSACRAVRQP